MSDEPRILFDRSTGRPILMAPQRRRRPILIGDKAQARPCPFCGGHEEHTPGEIDAARTAGTQTNGPGWSVRAFENLYPAAAHHIVIAEGAEHHQQPSALPVEVWEDALQLYRRRIHAMETEPEVRCAYLFKNVGQRAGASIEHNHTQILGLPMVPPRLELELQCAQAECVQCKEMADAQQQGRLVHQGTDHMIYCPSTPKLPFETVLAPIAHGDNFLEGRHTEDLATSLHTLFRAVDAAFDSPPFNLFLHRIPGEDFHWHLELQPRTGNLAGLEIGGDMYINAVPGDEAAARLRSGL